MFLSVRLSPLSSCLGNRFSFPYALVVEQIKIKKGNQTELKPCYSSFLFRFFLFDLLCFASEFH